MLLDTLGMYHRLRDSGHFADEQAYAIARETGRAMADPQTDQAAMRQRFCDVGFPEAQAEALTEVLTQVAAEWWEHRNRPR